MSGAGTPLGVFAVVGAAEDAASFRLATGLAGGDEHLLPLTFPMRWLAAADVRAAFRALVPDRDIVLVHESQSFEQAASLRVGEPYRLHLAARRESAPDRLVVEATVLDEAGAERATLATILRLVAAPDAPA